MVHEKRDESRGRTKGYPAGSPKTASCSSRCYSNSCDGGRSGDVELLTAPPRSMNQDPRQVGGVQVGGVHAGGVHANQTCVDAKGPELGMDLY